MSTLPFSQRPTDTPRAGHREDSMFEFHSEVARPRRSGPGPLRVLGRVLFAAAVVTAGIWAARFVVKPPPPSGVLRIESEPGGVAIEVNGSLRGLTPLSLNLPPGDYAIVASLDAQKQEFTATVSDGVRSVHHVRFAAPAAAETAPIALGALHVATEPPGGIVSVDGIERGAAPVTVENLAPGEHGIVVRQGGRSHERTATVEAGRTVSLVIPTAPRPASDAARPAANTGWLSAEAATPLRIFLGPRLVGTTGERIALQAGTHELQFTADALGFRARRTVTIRPGATTGVAVTLPQAPANFNAIPWAEVWVDGRSIGQTPLANVLLTIGDHEVEFRHPALGTKRATATVSLVEPVRVAVDMRAP